MLRALLTRVLPGFDGNRDETEPETDPNSFDETGSGFTRSRLDASVLHGHGADVELDGDNVDEIESQAQTAERERWQG
jgi:hypothetical protein